MRYPSSRFLLPVVLLLAVQVAGCGGSGTDTEPTGASTAPAREEHAEEHAAGEQAAGEQEGEAAGLLAEVHLGPERSEALGIRVATVEGGSARSIVLRPVTLRMDPDRKALVGPRIEAKVVRVMADLGDRVAEDDTLAILSSVELGRAKSAYLTAKARLKTAEAEYQREQSLHEKQISSEAELLEAEAAYTEARAELDAARETLRLYGLTLEDVVVIDAGGEQPLSFFPLRSPAAGRVQRRDLSPGQTVGPNETPIHVADVRRLWAMVEAYDQDVPILETGRPVELSVRNLPERTFQGEIDWISYELDPETRTLDVRAVVDNQDGLLRAGMYGTARMNLSMDVRNALLPVDAVQTLGEHIVVFVPGHEEGAFRPVEVQLGAESQDGRVEILAGIQPGDRAVTEGAFDLMSAATAAGRSAAHSH